MTAEQLPLLELPPWPSRRGEPIAAFLLPGDPQPWVRQQALHGNNMGWPSKSPFARWRKWAIRTLTEFWLGQGQTRPIRVPLIVQVVAVYPRPNGPPTLTIGGETVTYPWPWTPGRNPSLHVGDVDNLAKAVLDAAQQSGAFGGALLGDDRWVVDLRVSKCYAAEGEEPRTEVRLWKAS